MATKIKKSNDYKFGLTGTNKKNGLNVWRFIFNAVDSMTGAENMFYIELEILNPWVSQNEVILGFKTRVNFTQEDLQYALAGTESAKSLTTESIVQPSYCAVRIGKFGKNGKELCSYFPIKDLKINSKPFEVTINNKYFSSEKISGFIDVPEKNIKSHPEYFSDTGYAKWNLTYDFEHDYIDGYKKDDFRWFPFGLRTSYSGTLNFNGIDYEVDPKRCNGYMERFWGKTIVDPYFSISAENLTSVITGKTLMNSSFAVKGIFEDRVSFIGKFEDIDIKLCADGGKRQYNTVWSCVQMPESDNPDENLLHWSVSLNNKTWVIDIDVFCKIKELVNRLLELPEGSRKILNLLEGGSGTGEIKLYKKIGNTLEQIEHANLVKVVCGFGHSEAGEF